MDCFGAAGGVDCCGEAGGVDCCGEAGGVVCCVEVDCKKRLVGQTKWKKWIVDVGMV